MNIHFTPESLMLIPAAFAVVFMLWLLWRLQKEIKREKQRSAFRRQAAGKHHPGGLS